MKRIYLFILILFSLSAGAQTLPGYFAPISSPYDYQWLRARYLRLPLSATGLEAGAVRYNAADSSIYVYTGFSWQKAGGSTSIDSFTYATRARLYKALDSLKGTIPAYTFTGPLSESGGTVSITQANGSTNGYLSAVDWTLFNGKVSQSTLDDSTAVLRSLISAGSGGTTFEQALTNGNTLSADQNIVLGGNGLDIYGTYAELWLGPTATWLYNYATGGDLKLGTFNGTVTIEAQEAGTSLDLELKNLPAATGTNETALVIDNTTGKVRKGGAGGGGSSYTFQHSLSESAGAVNLVGDVATPGASKYYGTNGSGTRGFYDLPAGGGATTTADLTDVSDAAPANNSTLVYNGDSAKYVPTQVASYNLTSPANGDLLKYQDGQWVNFTPTYGSGSADSIAVTGTTDKAGFEFRPSDTALLVTYGGTTFSFKQSGAGSATSVVYETETQEFFTRYAAAGGATLTTAQKDAINDLIAWQKAQGLYTGLTELWPFVGGTDSTHALGFKNAYNITWSGGVAHSSSGVLPNGYNGYGNLGVSPSQVGSTSFHLAVYLRSAGTKADGYQMGTAETASDGYTYLSARSAHVYAAADGPGAQDALDVATSFVPGLYQLVKDGSTLTLYRNGVPLSATPAGLTEVIATYPIFLGAHNDHGIGASNHSDSEISFASLGSAMSAGQAETFYTKVQAIQTAFGRAL